MHLTANIYASRFGVIRRLAIPQQRNKESPSLVFDGLGAPIPVHSRGLAMITRDMVSKQLFPGAPSNSNTSRSRGGGGSLKHVNTNSGPNSRVKAAAGAGQGRAETAQKPGSNHDSINVTRRRAPIRPDRIDLTRMKSAEFNNLLDDIDEDLEKDNANIVNDEKEAEASRKESLDLVHSDVSQTKNIFETEEDDSTPATKQKPMSVDKSGSSDHPPKKSGPDNASLSTKPSSSPKSKNADDQEGLDLAGLTAHSPTHSLAETDPLLDDVYKELVNSRLNIETSDSKTQTDHTEFGCLKCTEFLSGVMALLSRHNICDHGAEPGNASLLSSSEVELPKGKTNDMGEKMVPLIKGCPQVLIPVSKKAAIDIDVIDGDPSKLVAYLLDCLYSTEELAQFTHDGKTAGTKPLPPAQATILKVYTDKKYNRKKFNFNSILFKEFVNSKCYQARRSVWANQPDLVGTKVRPKLQKNVKKHKELDEEKQQKKNKKDDSWYQDDSGHYSGQENENAVTSRKSKAKSRKEAPLKIGTGGSNSSSLDSRSSSKNDSRHRDRHQLNVSPRKLQALREKAQHDRSRTSFRKKMTTPSKRSPHKRDQQKRQFSRNDRNNDRRNGKTVSAERSNLKHQSCNKYEDNNSGQEDSDTASTHRFSASKRPYHLSTSTPKLGNKRPKYTDYENYVREQANQASDSDEDNSSRGSPTHSSNYEEFDDEQ